MTEDVYESIGKSFGGFPEKIWHRKHLVPGKLLVAAFFHAWEKIDENSLGRRKFWINTGGVLLKSFGTCHWKKIETSENIRTCYDTLTCL